VGASSNLEMNAVTEERDRITARVLDLSAVDDISVRLLDMRATTVGIKARIEAPADQRAV
jgi:hypothetical protein